VTYREYPLVVVAKTDRAEVDHAITGRAAASVTGDDRRRLEPAV
jgi:hypothetical protein